MAVAGCWGKEVVFLLDLAGRVTRRVRAFTGGGWAWATSGNCETCLSADIPRGKVVALPVFHIFCWELVRVVLRFVAATVFAVLTG